MSNMREIRVGLIGCGGIAQAKHIPNLRKKESVVIAAISDVRGAEYLTQVCGELGLKGTKCYADYREVLADPSIEVVHICTPNASHAELTIQALEAGKHVMCEKPMATTLEEAQAMVRAAEKSGKKLTICANNRFTPAMWYLKNRCAQGELGEIYFAKAHCVRRRGVPTWGEFLDKEKQGGGPVLDLGTHAVDLALWMMGNYRPRKVTGKAFYKLGRQGSPANPYGDWDPKRFTVEDSGFAMIEMENGAMIWLETSWALNTRDERPVSVTLCGTKAGADVTDGLTINTERDGRLVDEKIVLEPRTIPFYEPEQVYGPQLEISQWIDAVRNDTAPVVRPEEMYTVQRIIRAVYESSERGESVCL